MRSNPLSPGTARSRRLIAIDGAVATLTHYKRGSQDEHEHAQPHLSFHLVGAFQEVARSGPVEISTPCVGYKPAGYRHRNTWRENGALVLSLTIDEGNPQLKIKNEPGWRAKPNMAGVRSLLRVLSTAGANDRSEELIWDLVSLADVAGSAPPSGAPKWLEQIRERLIDVPGERISEISDWAGCHRVHFSRMFRLYYGVPPSVFRRQCLAARAVRGVIWDDQHLAFVAHTAGFADQSHAARSVRHETGLTMSALRNLLRRE